MGSDAYVGVVDKQRWREVGKCDGNLKCWLDTDSVANVIDGKTLREGVLGNTAQNQLDILKNENGYLSEGGLKTLLDKLNETKDPNERIRIVSGNLSKVFLSNEKAVLHQIRGDAYGELAKGLWGTLVKPNNPNSGTPSSSTPSTTISSGVDGEVYKEELNVISDTTLESINRELIDEGIDTSGLSNDEIIQKYEEIIPKLTGGYTEFVLEEGGISNPVTSYYLSNGVWNFALGRTFLLGKTDWKSYLWNYKFREASNNKLIGYEDGTLFTILNLKDKNYDQALKIFLDEVRFNNGKDGTACIADRLRCAKFYTDTVEFGFRDVFKYRSEIGNKFLFIKFVGATMGSNIGKWYWSNDGTTYYPFVDLNANAAVTGPGNWDYYRFYIVNSNLYSLAGDDKGFYGGAKIIFNFNRELNYEFVKNRPVEVPKIDIPLPVEEPFTFEFSQEMISKGAVKITENKIIVLGFEETLKKAAEKGIINSKCVDFASQVLVSSKKNDIPDPLLLVALMQIESSCDKTATSDGKIFKKKDGTKYVMTFDLGASYGLLEVSGRTWCGKHGLPNDKDSCIKALYDSQTNLNSGAAILSDYYSDKKDGVNYNSCGRRVTYYNWDAALRAYNGFGCYKGAEYYVENVMKIYNKLGKIAEGKSVN